MCATAGKEARKFFDSVWKKSWQTVAKVDKDGNKDGKSALGLTKMV